MRSHTPFCGVERRQQQLPRGQNRPDVFPRTRVPADAHGRCRVTEAAMGQTFQE